MGEVGVAFLHEAPQGRDIVGVGRHGVALLGVPRDGLGRERLIPFDLGNEHAGLEGLLKDGPEMREVSLTQFGNREQLFDDRSVAIGRPLDGRDGGLVGGGGLVAVVFHGVDAAALGLVIEDVVGAFGVVAVLVGEDVLDR